MYVDWEYYKIFYFVAKYRNFTKAARVLGSNQPNITHTMNKLEDQLHCVLFIRSNRGVTLTPEGEMLYTRISSAAVQIQDAEEELSASATFEHGAISISATETALNIYLSERLRDFHAQYPGIRLRISNHSTPQELDAYPLIMLGNESMSRLFYRQFFLEHSADLKPDIEAATTDQMMTLVKSELGLAFVPEPMARSSLQRRSIVQLTLREAIPQRSVSLVYDRHRPLNTAAREFQKQLLNAARQEKAE